MAKNSELAVIKDFPQSLSTLLLFVSPLSDPRYSIPKGTPSSGQRKWATDATGDLRNLGGYIECSPERLGVQLKFCTRETT